MTIRTAARIALAVALAVAAAGCTGGGGSHSAGSGNAGAEITTSPASRSTTTGAGGARTGATVAQLCGPPAAPGRLIRIRAADGVQLTAIEAGAGERGVLLIPELGAAGKCGWWDYATYLAAHGYHVLAFDHRCTGESGCPSGTAATDLIPDVRGAITRLRQAGATRVVLMGASRGGAEALIAATVSPQGVTGVVALSADQLAQRLARPPYPATALAAVRHLRLPALFAVAAADPYVSVQETHRLFAMAESRSRQLFLLKAGAGHGWDLLWPAHPGGPRPAISRAILAFLRRATS
jgi:pimeloyl-ACP methyl ester carboxylesterase